MQNGLPLPPDPLLTRRSLWRGLLALGAAPLLVFWAGLGRDRRERAREKEKTLPRPATDGVWFHGDVILVREGGAVRALSARCPHLGCRIDRALGGELVCPCHGSRFDAAGVRLAGPAAAGLVALRVEAGATEETLRVVLA